MWLTGRGFGSPSWRLVATLEVGFVAEGEEEGTDRLLLTLTCSASQGGILRPFRGKWRQESPGTGWVLLSLGSRAVSPLALLRTLPPWQGLMQKSQNMEGWGVSEHMLCWEGNLPLSTSPAGNERPQYAPSLQKHTGLEEIVMNIYCRNPNSLCRDSCKAQHGERDRRRVPVPGLGFGAPHVARSPFGISWEG